MKKINNSECFLLESSNLIFFDVDETLIFWDVKSFGRETARKDIMEVRDPYMAGHIIKFYPHISHINILKRNKEQGRIVVVWSAAGHLWAKAIIEKLKLEKYVTLILDKPTLYCDDISMEHWNPKRIYLSKDIEGSNG